MPRADYLVYIGTYTAKTSKGIYAYRFNPATGRLVSLGLAAETVSPSFLAIAPDGDYLYAVNETIRGKRDGGVSAFAINRRTGKLAFLNQVSSLGTSPCYVSLDKTGKYVLVANYGSGSVAVFPVGPDGRLGKASAFIQHTGSSVNPRRQRGPHAHSVNVSPDNRFAISADLGLDKLLVDHFNAMDGTLTPANPAFARVEAGSGPRHFVFSPNGRFLYVVSEMGSIVTAFSYDASDGVLHRLQTLSSLPKSFKGDSTGAEIDVLPSGEYLYASNRGSDTIAVFRINGRKGTLTPVQYEPTGGKNPRNFEIDPTGSYLFAANQDSASVVIFRINQKTGRLSPTGRRLDLDSPVCVKFLAVGD